MHQSWICDTFVIDILKHVDIYDNLICVTEAVGLGIILVNCRPFATLVQEIRYQFQFLKLSFQLSLH